MKVTNEFNLPDPVVKALTHDDYTKGDSNRSVTQLIDSPRYRILKHEHKDEITMDVSELIWIALGKGIHAMFEGHAEGKWKAEQRIFADVHGWRISGAVDIQEIATDESTGITDIVIYDYKCTSVFSVIFGKDAFAQQLNFYRWLIEKQNPKYRVVGVRIIFVLRDWKKSEMLRRGKDYPRAPIMVQSEDLWSQKKVEQYVNDRVLLHQDAEFARITGDTLPLCTPAERWERPTKYAVKKPANKTAKRVLSSFEEAEKYIEDEGLADKGFEVEVRPGAPVRCADEWCPVAQWCDQWQNEKEATDG